MDDTALKIAKAKADMYDDMMIWVWRLTYLTLGFSGLNFVLIITVLLRLAKLETQ